MIPLLNWVWFLIFWYCYLSVVFYNRYETYKYERNTAGKSAKSIPDTTLTPFFKFCHQPNCTGLIFCHFFCLKFEIFEHDKFFFLHRWRYKWQIRGKCPPRQERRMRLWKQKRQRRDIIIMWGEPERFHATFSEQFYHDIESQNHCEEGHTPSYQKALKFCSKSLEQKSSRKDVLNWVQCKNVHFCTKLFRKRER